MGRRSKDTAPLRERPPLGPSQPNLRKDIAKNESHGVVSHASDNPVNLIFKEVIAIPKRENKADGPGPHTEFTVVIHLNQGMLVIRATIVESTRDYYEIIVRGEDDVKKVLEQFGQNYNLIANSLRIMNDVMVLLNPVSFDNLT